MHAARNIKLCTKDCLCLFVCPTGATDTETGQIDFSRCIDGCRLCVDVCPSHAISLVLDSYPEPKIKPEKVQAALYSLLERKAKEEALCTALASAEGPDKAMATAFARSNRILAEDCARELAYLLPQSDATRRFLAWLLEQPYGDDFAFDAVRRLLELI